MGLLKLLLGAVTLAITLGTSRPAWAAQESGISAGDTGFYPYLRCTGDVDDPGPGYVLRRHGAQQEHTQCTDAVPGYYGSGLDTMDINWLYPVFWS